jgi:catechol 2,3-dioxygenase-like lactoylglutathione lyase family enzyme
MAAQPRFGFVVVYAKDLDKAKRFYAESLGLKVEREAPNFIQFEHFAVASDEPLSPKGEPELYWLVDDAEAAYRQLAAKAPVSRPLESKPFGKVFAVRDPDGGDRFVLELARNRPSKAVQAGDEPARRP